jgi:hypothetical protein
MALATMPLRMAFAPPDTALDAGPAARHYAFRMAFVLGLAAGLFAAQALASRISADPIVSIFLGLLFLLAPLLVVPPILTARREKRPLFDVLAAGAKGIAVAVAVVVALALLVVLRASSNPRPTTVHLPTGPIDFTPPTPPISTARPAR